jgi:hypothetical protein
MLKRLTAWVQLGWQEEVGQVREWVVSDEQGAGCKEGRAAQGSHKTCPHWGMGSSKGSGSGRAQPELTPGC